MRRLATGAAWVALAALIVLAPLSGWGSDKLLLVNLILIYAIFAIGYDLAFGLTGLLSLGHAAFFGLGGYTLTNLTLRLHWPFEAALLASGVLAAALAGAMGFLALRMTGIFFALTTLAFGQLCYIVASTRLRGLTGGLDGISGVPRPRLLGLDFTSDLRFLYYNLAVFAVLLLVAGRIRNSPFGQVLAGIRLNAPRIEQLGWRGEPVSHRDLRGIGVLCRHRRRAAGLAAVLYQPADDELDDIGRCADHVHPGRRRHPVRPGARRRGVRTAARPAREDDRPLVWHARPGVRGGDPVRADRPDRRADRLAPTRAARRAVTIALECRAVSVSYGRFRAVSDFSYRFEAGRLYGVIGPNGAGKTTLMNVIVGGQPVTDGSVLLEGQDVTALGVAARARRGLGRSFQITKIFAGMTVFENLRLAAQARAFTRQPIWRAARFYAQLAARAEEMLAIIGLERQAATAADRLSHGDQRALELGLALMTSPRILLLDEPLAGMGHDALPGAIALLARIARDRTVLLIEHNMNAVMELAEELLVMENGRLIASGSPEEVRRDPTVRTAYLGSDA